ncbi:MULTISPECIES: MFS transporter [unclassified Bacillus (in: firmicutes)]|uniref:MFS transporter n=1 Tax=unclassified Bacillus (in: firmicutes) TaxID=185979 RepID=UPI001BE9D63E|nr:MULTISPECIES: MFS transporter [unclassified Bacillus (in: firmicutes)]MBT2640040.1 MFS transporter [Bacillus sp. ISL-39]MBT2662821.1 MFS transporter [Bacillus sp. ISL-45]
MMLFETLRSDFALKSSSYRRFLYGSFFVRTADWMELTILNWVVYQWTSSAVALGAVNACRLLPVFLFSAAAGSAADRFQRRNSLFILYGALFLMTVWMSFNIKDPSSFGMLTFIIVLKSILMSFEVPIRNAYLSDIVPASMLGSAITLQTTCINVARMIGPALAGVLLASFPPALLLFYVSLGTLFVLLSLWTIPQDEQNVYKGNQTHKSISETWQYLKKEPAIPSILLLAIAPMIFGFPYTTMLPLLSEELMDTGSEGFGLLLSVSSAGAIISTVVLSWRQPYTGGKWLILSSLGFGASLILFTAFSQIKVLAFILIFLVGFSSQYYRTLSRIIVQLKVAEEHRGRILSFALMDRGYIPLGAILIGFVANIFGAYSAGLFMGIGTIVITLIISQSNRRMWKE